MCDHLFMETIKERVKALRMARRITQAELARQCEVSQPSIANIEGGRTTEIKGYLLDRMAKALNTTPSYILSGADSEDSREATMMTAELTSIFSKLSPDDQHALLRTARGMFQATSQKGTVQNPFPLLALPVP
jgi:transcriptional regulator with XRE-family HTH domain